MTLMNAVIEDNSNENASSLVRPANTKFGLWLKIGHQLVAWLTICISTTAHIFTFFT